MKEIVIRALRETDLEAVLGIYNEVALNSTATFEEQPPPLEEFASAYKEKIKFGHPWIVAELNREVVGYGTYGSFRRASGYRITVEHSLHVRSDIRGKGVGSRILGHLIELATNQSYHSMIAVSKDDERHSARKNQFDSGGRSCATVA